LSKKKETKGPKAQQRKGKEGKDLTPTQQMMQNLSSFTQSEADALPKKWQNLEPTSSEDMTKELLAVQTEAVAKLQQMLRDAELSMNPEDPKSKYLEAPLDVDHFFAEYGLPEEGKSYNKLIHTCAMRGEMNKALVALEQMKKSGFEPDVYTYASMILLQRAQRSALSVDQAFRWWEEMISNGIVPSIQTYGALIEVCSKAKDHTKVEKVLNELEERGLKPNEHITSAVLAMYTNLGFIDKVWDSYYELTYKGAIPNDYTYCVLLRACARRKEVERGLALLSDMKVDDIVPSRRTYNAAIHLCSTRTDTYLQGFELFTELCDNHHSPDKYTLAALLLCCARVGDVTNALRLTRQFIRTYEMELDASHYENLFNTIATSMTVPTVDLHTPNKDEALDYHRYGAHARERRLMEQELSAPETRKDCIRLAKGILKDMKATGVEPTMRTLNQYLRVFTCAAGPPAPTGPDRVQKEGGDERQLKQAEELFERLHQSHGMTPDTHAYTSMLHMYCERRGEEEKLTSFLKRMRKDGINLGWQQYNALLARYERQEHYQAFLDVLHEMHQKQIEIPRKYRKRGEEMVEEILQARETKREQEAYRRWSQKTKIRPSNKPLP